MRFLLLAILFAGCVEAPNAEDCKEFDHHTVRHGKGVVCRMLACHRGQHLADDSTGIATLWCEEDSAADGKVVQ